jgi:hypothetical protein
MPNKRSQYFVILFKTFPLLLTLPNSSSAALFAADRGIEICYERRAIQSHNPNNF